MKCSSAGMKASQHLFMIDLQLSNRQSQIILFSTFCCYEYFLSEIVLIAMLVSSYEYFDVIKKTSSFSVITHEIANILRLLKQPKGFHGIIQIQITYQTWL